MIQDQMLVARRLRRVSNVMSERSLNDRECVDVQRILLECLEILNQHVEEYRLCKSTAVAVEVRETEDCSRLRDRNS